MPGLSAIDLQFEPGTDLLVARQLTQERMSQAKALPNVAVAGTQSPLRIGDVANVTEDHQPLIGDASLDGAPSLMLVVERFPDANTAQVTRDVDEALDAMAPGLAGIEMDAHVFRPASFITTALRQLGVAGLVGGLLLVVAVGG